MKNLICHCGCVLKANCKDSKVFVLCLDCGYFQEETDKNNEKDLFLPICVKEQ